MFYEQKQQLITMVIILDTWMKKDGLLSKICLSNCQERARDVCTYTVIATVNIMQFILKNTLKINSICYTGEECDHYSRSESLAIL